MAGFMIDFKELLALDNAPDGLDDLRWRILALDNKALDPKVHGLVDMVFFIEVA